MEEDRFQIFLFLQGWVIVDMSMLFFVFLFFFGGGGRGGTSAKNQNGWGKGGKTIRMIEKEKKKKTALLFSTIFGPNRQRGFEFRKYLIK